MNVYKYEWDLMNINFKKFNRRQLPLNNDMLSNWNADGYLVIDEFYSSSECDNLRKRAKELTNDFDHNSYQSIFDTNNQNHSDDQYFLESGDKIRFFFEKKAFDNKGNLNNSIELVINKIVTKKSNFQNIFVIFYYILT